jgi:hypothetical protein
MQKRSSVISKGSRFGLAAAVLIACGAPTALCGCPPALGIGTLAGVVSRRGEQPVVGALVRLELSLTGCGMTDLHPVGREVAVTRYDGTGARARVATTAVGRGRSECPGDRILHERGIRADRPQGHAATVSDPRL